MQIMARAFVPDAIGTKLPQETLTALKALEEEIAMDLDLEVAEEVPHLSNSSLRLPRKQLLSDSSLDHKSMHSLFVLYASMILRTS